MGRVGISVVVAAVIAAGLVHGSTPQDPTVLAPTMSTAKPTATPAPTVLKPKRPAKHLKPIPSPVRKHRRGNCCDVDPQMCGKGSPSG